MIINMHSLGTSKSCKVILAFPALGVLTINQLEPKGQVPRNNRSKISREKVVAVRKNPIELSIPAR